MTSGLRSSVVELRQYALHPGRRESLIDLFDRELIESQEACGIEVIGQFRDLDRPDVFTWLRGFRCTSARATALRAFYEGPVWARYRDAANATMINHDNVRLLHRVLPGTGFRMRDPRPAPGATHAPDGVLAATIYTLASSSAKFFPEWFQRELVPILEQTGARPVASFETEQAINAFPRLAVREGEHAFVWFAGFADSDSFDRHGTALERNTRWCSQVAASLTWHLHAPPEVWRLTPTARSRLIP